MSAPLPISPAELAPPAGFRARAPLASDASAVAALRAACELADHGRATTTAEEVADDWAAMNLAEDAVLIAGRDGAAAAYADVFNRAYVQISVYGFVHPEHRGRGLGAFLVGWGEAWADARLFRAPPGAEVALQHYVPSGDRSAGRLLGSHGYALVRAIYEMRIDFDGPPAPPVWPAGIVVRSFVPGQDERPAYDAFEEASADMWSRPAGTYQAWLGFTGRADKDLLFIAEDVVSREIAAVNACSLVESHGVIGGLRVRAGWRRQGLALGLLRHAFAEFYGRGATHATLSVDAASPTNAPALYLRAGMRVTREYAIYRKIVRPAADG